MGPADGSGAEEARAWPPEHAGAVLDACGDLVAVADAELRVRYLSPSNTEALGFPMEVMLGRRITSNVLPADRARLVRACTDVLDGATGRAVVQYRAGRVDGTTGVFETVLTPLGSGPEPMAVMVTRDVTERVGSETKLRRRAAADALVSELSRALLEAEPADFDGIMTGALRCTAAFVGADEVVLGRVPPGGDRVVPTHRWCQTDPPPRRDTGHGAAALLGALSAELLAEPRRIVRGTDADPATAATRAALARRGFEAGAYLTVRLGDRLGGLLGFGWRRNPARLEEGDLEPFGVLADVFTSALERHDALLLSERREQRLRLLAEHASDLVLVYGADGVVTYLSPSAQRFLGQAEGFAVGDRPHHIHPDDHVEVLDRFRRLVADGPGAVTGRFAVRVRRADGAYRWIEMVATNLLGDPAVEGILINGHDVTDARAATDALAASEARWRALVQGISEVVTLIGPDGTVRYTSPAAARVFGFTDGDPSEQDPLGQVHPDDVERVRAEFTEVLAGRRDPPIAFRLRDAAGRWRHVECTAVDHRDDPQLAGVLVTTRDVTARARAEQLLADQAAILARIARGDPAAEVLAGLCRAVERYDDGWRCSVMVADPAGAWLRCCAAPSLPEPLLDVLEGGIRVGEGVGTCGTAAARGEVVVTPDVADDPAWTPWRDLAGRVGIRSCWSVPVFDAARRRVVATLAVYGSATGSPDAEVRRTVETLADLAAIVLERDATEERLVHQAHHDALTGLPNRALFQEFLDRALARGARTGETVALLYFDLDRFKVVNDSLGHTAGDRMLVELGRRLQSAVRAGDVVARLGGDEFAVLCENLAPGGAAARAIEVAERILHAVDDPVDVDGTEVRVTASVGIAIGGSGTDAVGLLRDADAAMFRAKEAGRACWWVFDAETRRAACDRFEGERALRAALDEGTLRVHYQPILDPRTRRCVGVEALLRWPSPDGAFRCPDIALAEETGLIHPIGDVVLDTALGQLAAWRRVSGRDHLGLTVGVNLAAAQLRHPGIVEAVASALRRHDVPAGALCLEITESVLVIEEARRHLEALHDLGVRFAIDDFGTGYSSLSYLQRLPVDVLKIDRDFVVPLMADPRAAAIAGSVVELGHALGLTVVAEGVETPAQLERLVELGCDLVQGFLFAPALEAAELERRFLRRGDLPAPAATP